MLFKLILPTNGIWTFNFVPDSTPGLFDFKDGTFLATAQVTPEPGTISLMLTGLAGIAGIVKKKEGSVVNLEALNASLGSNI